MCSWADFVTFRQSLFLSFVLSLTNHLLVTASYLMCKNKSDINLLFEHCVKINTSISINVIVPLSSTHFFKSSSCSLFLPNLVTQIMLRNLFQRWRSCTSQWSDFEHLNKWWCTGWSCIIRNIYYYRWAIEVLSLMWDVIIDLNDSV